jgi:hypothetical protein
MMSGQPWTEKEKEMLRKLSEAKCFTTDAMRVFPSRTKSSISSQARNMGLSFSGPEAEINMEEFKKLIKGKQ